MNKLFRINIVCLIMGIALIALGLLFKFNHWPQANIVALAGLTGSVILALSLISLFIFLIIFYIKNRPNY